MAVAQNLKPGDTVSVDWGLEGTVTGTIVEVWGDPPTQVRVRIDLDESDPDIEPQVLLLPPSTVSAV